MVRLHPMKVSKYLGYPVWSCTEAFRTMIRWAGLTLDLADRRMRNALVSLLTGYKINIAYIFIYQYLSVSVMTINLPPQMIPSPSQLHPSCPVRPPTASQRKLFNFKRKECKCSLLWWTNAFYSPSVDLQSASNLRWGCTPRRVKGSWSTVLKSTGKPDPVTSKG